jgi:tyrosinase
MAFKIQPPAGPAKVRGKSAMAIAPPLGNTYLHIENVVSKKSHASYEVYVNLPEKANAAAYEQHYAGTMHLFGVPQASTRSEHHAGNGLQFSLDITKLVDALKSKNAWDDKNVRVTFAPRGAGEGVRGAIPEHDPIKIGRISLHRE